MKTAVLLIAAIAALLFIFISCGRAKARKTPPALQARSSSDRLYTSNVAFSFPHFIWPAICISRYELPNPSKVILSDRQQFRPGFNRPFFSVTVPAGAKYQIDLQQGNSIYLNSASELVFHPFTGRYLELCGEGYFVITEDSTLIVVNHQTNVLTYAGTCIHITAYNDLSSDLQVIASLVKGRALVTCGGTKTLLNAPGRQVTIQLSNQTKELSAFDSTSALSWKNGYFDYVDADAAGLLHRICRWYDVKITNRALPKERIKMYAGFTTPLQEVVNRFNRAATKMECRLEGKELKIHMR